MELKRRKQTLSTFTLKNNPKILHFFAFFWCDVERQVFSTGSDRGRRRSWTCVCHVLSQGEKTTTQDTATAGIAHIQCYGVVSDPGVFLDCATDGFG